MDPKEVRAVIEAAASRAAQLIRADLAETLTLYELRVKEVPT